jgi:hypothetical protein
MRVAPETVIAELESAGFAARISATGLPDQYIVAADLTDQERNHRD